MPDRIPSQSNSPASQVPSARSEPPKPADSPAVDRAAAEFASLIGADENQANARARQNEDAAGAQAFESEQTSSQQRVEENKRDGHGSGEGNKDQSGKGEEGKKGDGGKGEGEGRGGDKSGEPQLALGDAILRSLSRGGEAGPVQATQGPRDATLDGIVQQIADKILVSEPTSGQKEVRILLKESVLPGTEVRISQNAGKLQIQLVTNSERSNELLNQNQSALQQRLTEKLAKHDVVVNIEMDGQGQPDPDGRSRQRQEITDEDDDA